MPDRGDAGRSRDMQTTWQAFCLERHDMVRATLDSRRSAPEIAYHLGEMIHTYFRPRGVTLSGQELRRLVAELVGVTEDRPGASPDEPAPPPSSPPPPPASPPPPAKGVEKESGDAPKLVTFRAGDQPADGPARRPTTWTGDEPSPKQAPVPESVFAPMPSPLVTVPPRHEVGFDRLLERTLQLVRPRLAGDARVERDEALRAIDAALDEVVRGETRPPPAPDVRERVVTVALSEVCGLGLIDRLWADRSVRAVYVDGPKSVLVEREGGLGPAVEVFRDQAHLLELVSRLAAPPPGGVAEFHLRDGSTGTVIFPPTAPNGPVLVIRRADPGNTTLGRLLALEALDQKTAGLLRIAARARLRILVAGAPGAGKTALLAALARDLDASMRLVAVARHRAFGWTSSTKVELVVSREARYQTLLSAGEKLRPDLFLLDSIYYSEGEAVAGMLSRGTQGALIGCELSSLAPSLMRVCDLVVRLERGRDGVSRAVSFVDAAGAPIFVHEEGRFQLRGRAPAFVDKVRRAGYGEALAALLR